VPVEDIRRFERELLDYLHREKGDVIGVIRETKQLPDETVDALTSAVAEFKKGFETASGELLIKDEPVGILDESKVGQEKITRHVRKPAQQ
jgi:F-type H+/Na+-transporting ATPase subunit alpha